MHLFRLVLFTWITSQVILKADENKTSIEILYASQSKIALVDSFNPNRIEEVKINNEKSLFIHKRGSAILKWEYYYYVQKAGWWRMRWLYVSDEKLIISLDDKSNKLRLLDSKGHTVAQFD